MAPFDNVHVRLAIKHGIDRQEVVDKIFLGHATPGNDNPIAPSIKYSIDPEPKHSYDPDKAKFHLKEAGLSSLQVDLSAADAAFGGAVDTAVLFKEHASKGGIDINVVREPADGYWDNVWLKKAWCASYWSGRPTIDWMFSTAYKGGAAWNETFWGRAIANRPCRDGREDARRHVRRDAAARARRRRPDRSGVQQSPRGLLHQAGPRRDRAELGVRRPADRRALVVRVIRELRKTTAARLSAWPAGRRGFHNIFAEALV
jgi:peptide/nickel transport system substrate-binding protein